MVVSTNEQPSNAAGTLDPYGDVSAVSSPRSRQDTKGNTATGASAAGARAVSSQLIAFYFRAPAKAFFRTRVEVQANEPWSWRMSSIGLLTHAIRSHGWGFIPNQILPPLFANVTAGAVLYTSYLQLLGKLYPLAWEPAKRVYPPLPLTKTFIAGCAAGAVQSVVAAPLDALSVRFRPSDMLDGRYKTMWQYGNLKSKEIGLRGMLAGWSLSFLKDAAGYGLFFATFEYVKAQSYYAFITRYYGSLDWQNLDEEYRTRTIRPYFAIEPMFLLLAGISASVAQQTVHHPLERVQEIYYRSLAKTDQTVKATMPISSTTRIYIGAYRRTLEQCRGRANRFGGWRKWLYKGFLRNTIRQVPSTSAGLVIFEMVRRRYGDQAEVVRIEKDGYDIVLT
ncbi:MAG: hypothetical protein LQ350_004469 [Teloschistes chrysophthalmus]|nr:MAG: hypothetical protein LQ350_004469 [Niorma chrysophthalma]